MMIKSGAVGIFYYERTIPVKAVQIILREASQVIKENPLMKADEAFRETIKRIIDGINRGEPEYSPHKHLKRQLEDMLNNFTFVQRLPGRQPRGIKNSNAWCELLVKSNSIKA